MPFVQRITRGLECVCGSSRCWYWLRPWFFRRHTKSGFCAGKVGQKIGSSASHKYEKGKKLLKVMFHCWEYPPRGSGIGRYIHHMSQALREAGHFTVVMTSHGAHGSSEESLQNGMVYRVYDVQDIGKPHIAELVLQKACEHHVDWIEGADHLGESALLLERKPLPPVIIKAHYNDVLKCARYAQVCCGWQKPLIDIACWRDRKRLQREKDSLGKADVLLASSARILQEMEKQGLQLPVRRCVMPNPISPIANWVNEEAVEPTILLVGRIDIGKGIEYLPSLLDALILKFPTLRLEIAGGDSYARLLGSTRLWLLRKLGARSKHVSFLGEIGSAALDAAYRRAWVVIVPSRWDTFPTVVLEAMSRSKAIVASPNGGMPEMLEGTGNFVSDPAAKEFSEAVLSLLGDRQSRDRAGSSGFRKSLQAYNPQIVAKQHVDFVSSCL